MHDQENDNDKPPPLLRILEAMLFVNDVPLTEARACGTIRGLTPEDFHEVIDTINTLYRSQNRPYYVRLRDEGYVMELRGRFAIVRERMRGAAREARLSLPAIEVLSLIAYRQPITREDIDTQRGEPSNALLRRLVRHGLISIQRREKEAAYITTPRFLELFKLSSLDDLPRTEEVRQL